jgi:ABC-type lipoprotein release transport system permease subunit
LIGMTLALGAAYVQVQLLLDIPLALPWPRLLALIAAMTAISALAGLIACRRALTAPPLATLRDG